MGKISFRDNGEEHNFWQNYTDLMSGFLIIFIIASLVAYGESKIYVDLYHKKGITEGNIDDIVVKAELYNKIQELQDAQKSIKGKYFKYNEEYQRFECSVDVLFLPETADIPAECKKDLKEAGEEIQAIIDGFKESANVSFKVVIEGRAAKSHEIPNPTKAQEDFAARLSYERAHNLYRFWEENNILKDINEKKNSELFISGSGYGGKGRYTGLGSDGEDKNKTFIIQIIPYVN